VTLGPSDAYYMEDEAPPGPTYANPLTTTPPIYEEEALDAEELASGKLKKATMEDKLNRAVKKTRASIAEPVATIESDMDEDVCMQDMESDGAYTSLYDKDETVMEDWEEMPPPALQKARKKKEFTEETAKKYWKMRAADFVREQRASVLHQQSGG
jgi:hypothetical protein